MAEAGQDWSSDSNEAFHISLVVPGAGAPKPLHTFNPKMTYSIFGDEERIFGYQGLNINLRYHASDMRPSLQIAYKKKFRSVGETQATDVKEILEPFLPKGAFEKSAVFDQAIEDPIYKDWHPPGELWRTIQSGDKTFEVRKGSLADPAIQQMLKRVQILVPLFIEGGTVIELDDPEWTLERWTVFFLYQKRHDIEEAQNPYVFMGYSTVYRYFHFQNLKRTTQSLADFTLPLDTAPFSSLPCRSRISQFVILPPFQGGGNGSRFYNSIFDFYYAESSTIEITVEDPNEAFDDMRDINDLFRLRTLPEFTSIAINNTIPPLIQGSVPRNIVDVDKLERMRKTVKIAPRQFARVVEMHLLSKIPASVRTSFYDSSPDSAIGTPAETHEYYLWQLWVKKRLYKHNKDTLIQLDGPERIDKLEQALEGVEADYVRLLESAEQRVRKAAAGKGGKRTSVSVEGGPAAKKQKMSA